MKLKKDKYGSYINMRKSKITTRLATSKDTPFIKQGNKLCLGAIEQANRSWLKIRTYGYLQRKIIELAFLKNE